MDAHELTIDFRGICTHFLNAVPGVPHRVVLPQTATWRPGAFSTPAAGPIAYLLEPHLAHVFVAEGGTQHFIDAPGMEDGWLTRRLRLEVANAIDEPLQYPELGLPAGELPFAALPRVAEYATNFQLAEDVLLGGRVQLYFDLFSGGVVTVMPYGAALRTAVRIRTDGPPRLKVTLLDTNGPYTQKVTALPAGTLVLGNTSTGCEDASNDYLWHMLSSQGSIPLELPRLPYGFSGDAMPIDREGVAQRFRELLDGGYPECVPFPPPVAMNATDASCSNSQWP